MTLISGAFDPELESNLDSTKTEEEGRVFGNLQTRARPLSVIVPVYNSESSVERALDSLVPLTVDIAEIIISDDGSRDRTLDVVRRWSGSHSVQVQIVHANNSGAGAARNRGFAHANGDWVLFLDADDTVNSDHLKTLLAEAVAADARFIAVAGGREERLSDGQHREVNPDARRWATIDPVSLMELWLKRTGPPIHLGSVLARRSALTMPLFPETRVGQDREFITSLIARGEIKFTDHISLNYNLDVRRQWTREAEYADDLVKGSTFAFSQQSSPIRRQISNIDDLSRQAEAVAHLIAMRALSKAGKRRACWRHWIEAVRLFPTEAARLVYVKRLVR